MIIKRIYGKEDLDDRVELVTDNVKHFLLEEKGKYPNTKKSIQMINAQSESMGEIKLDFSTVVDEDRPEYFAPQGYNLYSVYIMNDEGKTIERFVHGFDYSIDSLDTSVFTNSNKKGTSYKKKDPQKKKEEFTLIEPLRVADQNLADTIMMQNYPTDTIMLALGNLKVPSERFSDEELFDALDFGYSVDGAGFLYNPFVKMVGKGKVVTRTA